MTADVPMPSSLKWIRTDRWTAHCPIMNTDLVIIEAKGGMFWPAWPDAPEGRTDDLDALKASAAGARNRMLVVALLGTHDRPDDCVWMTPEAEDVRMHEIGDEQLVHILGYAQRSLNILTDDDQEPGVFGPHVREMVDRFTHEAARRGLATT